MPRDTLTSPIRVLVADDEENIRAALSALIDGEEGLELVGAAPDFGAATELAEREKPDVALVDVKMPGGGRSGRDPRDHRRFAGNPRDRAVRV
jgi:DNA-binding NarL/FixJ family response regulator